MDAQHIIDLLYGTIIGLLGYVMKNQNAKTEKLSDELGNFKVRVTSDFAKKDSMDKRFDKIEVKLDKLLDRLIQDNHHE